MYIDRQYQTSTDCLSITDIKNSPLFNMYPRSRCSTRLLTSMSIFKNEVLIISLPQTNKEVLLTILPLSLSGEIRRAYSRYNLNMYACRSSLRHATRQLML